MSVIADDPKSIYINTTESRTPEADSKRRKSATIAKVSKSGSAIAANAPFEFTKVKRMNTLKYVVKQKKHPPLKSKALSFSYFQIKDISENIAANSWSETKNEVPEESLSDNEEVQELTMDISGRGSTLSSSSSSGGETPCAEDPSPLTSIKTPTETTSTEMPSVSQLLCSVCRGRLSSSDTIIQYDLGTIHLKCFLCGRCGHPMGAVEEFLVQLDGSPLCHSCTPSCFACKSKIFHDHVSVLKKDFHEKCLSCTQCKKPLNLITKIYANGNEPCCANCITPVFNDVWSPTKLGLPPLPPRTGSMKYAIGTLNTLSPSPSTDSGVSDSASNDGTCDVIVTESAAASCPGTSKTPSLNPKLESLSRSIQSYGYSPVLIRATTSETNLSKSINPSQPFSISSLKGILFDEQGALFFLNYCINNNVIEYAVFWLDVEHYKHFDGGDEDLKLFAHHIVTKYVGYYAELPIPLPRSIQQYIFTNIEGNITSDMFDDAQEYIYSKMEKELLHDFIQSDDGKAYLEALVVKDLLRMKKSPHSSTETLTRHAQARITNFDKRHTNTKFYVYEVRVENGDASYYIYRRYSEWHSLNQKLRKTFPLEVFPSLPKKIFLRRSQIRVVAEQRMVELQTYLQGLLSMNAEILNSYVFRKFLTQTDMDKEDEKFNKRIEEFQRKLSK